MTKKTKMSKIVSWKLAMVASLMTCLLLSGCHKHEAEHEAEHEGGEREEGESKLIVTRPLRKDTTVMRDFVCQIHSVQNIEIRALERGYLNATHVKEGQRINKGESMFEILPLVYQAELRSAEADARVAEVKYLNTKRLTDSKVVSEQELAIAKAELEKAQAEVNLAQTHLGFTNIKAPFSGLMDRLLVRQGSLVEEGDLLTKLSDNSEMWIYFNVPESEYLDYASHDQPEERKSVALMMANGQVFEHRGRINAIEAEFNNQTGTIMFRADFPNPDGLLRHGETGNIQMQKLVRNAVLIPQKCTYEILDHHYVYVLDKDDVVTQQRVHISEELEDLFIVSEGLTEKDRIVLEGLRHVRNGEKATHYEIEEPEEAFKHLKLRAE